MAYNGYTVEQLKSLIDLVSKAEANTAEARRELAELQHRSGLTEGAVRTLLGVLKQGDVPVDQLPLKLGEITAQYKQAVELAATLDSQDPTTKDLVERAQAAIETGRLDEAGSLLDHAKQIKITEARQAQKVAAEATAAAN